MYQQRNELPKFDIALAVRNTAVEWPGGLAYLGGACALDRSKGDAEGVAVFSDEGDFEGVLAGTHEIAHT